MDRSPTRDRRLLFVRAVLWFGVIADFVCVLQYCLPQTSADTFGVTLAMTPFVRFTLIQAAALMAAWTLLLVWTDRRPLERRGVMLLTVPIALGIAGSFSYLIAAGAITGARTLLVILPLVTAALFLAAFLTARRLAKTR